MRDGASRRKGTDWLPIPLYSRRRRRRDKVDFTTAHVWACKGGRRRKIWSPPSLRFPACPTAVRNWELGKMLEAAKGEKARKGSDARVLASKNIKEHKWALSLHDLEEAVIS